MMYTTKALKAKIDLQPVAHLPQIKIQVWGRCGDKRELTLVVLSPTAEHIMSRNDTIAESIFLQELTRHG